ncbi:MAG: nitrate reductase molybdenum cofactor assembly chaperone [Sneathiella sp.]
MKTFKILGLLLTYPTQELQDSMKSLASSLSGENLLPRKLEKAVIIFMGDLAARNLLEAQEDYVSLFDRGRGHSLYLFEHIHGESRDRGQAMVDLIDHYKEKGLNLTAQELPDYLPLFLEFLSICPVAEAQENLGDVVHIVAAIAAKLKKKGSGYHVIFAALAKLTDVRIDQEFVRNALIEDDARDDSLEALDKEWEETPAFDGIGDAAACSTCPSAGSYNFGSADVQSKQAD